MTVQVSTQATAKSQKVTARQLAEMPREDVRVELVKGEIAEMAPASAEHGAVAGNVFAALHHFVRQHKLGRVFIAETGFILTRNPDTVRAPDTAFVSAQRLAEQLSVSGFFDGAPDLAVEVVSPNDQAEVVTGKVLDYLQSGTRQVWVVHPRSRTITVYRSLADIHILTDDEVLEGGDLLPGFKMPVAEIFA